MTVNKPLRIWVSEYHESHTSCNCCICMHPQVSYSTWTLEITPNLGIPGNLISARLALTTLIPIISEHYGDSKGKGANMGPTWVLTAPDGPHVGHLKLAIRVGTFGWIWARSAEVPNCFSCNPLMLEQNGRHCNNRGPLYWITLWGRDEMAACSQTTFQTNIFEWKCMNFA